MPINMDKTRVTAKDSFCPVPERPRGGVRFDLDLIFLASRKSPFSRSLCASCLPVTS